MATDAKNERSEAPGPVGCGSRWSWHALCHPSRLGWDDNCCGGGPSSRITYLPVPFFIRVERTSEGQPGLIERAKSGRLALGMGGGLCVFAGLFMMALLVLPVPKSPVVAVKIGACTLMAPFGVYLLLSANRRGTTARRLVFFNRDLALSIQTIRKGAIVESEARRPIGECQLSIHSVRLIGNQVPDFNGWIARVSVGDRCFTLACCKTEAQLLEYVQRLPNWLLAISTGEGEKIVAAFPDRWIGRPPREFRAWW